MQEVSHRAEFLSPVFCKRYLAVDSAPSFVSTRNGKLVVSDDQLHIYMFSFYIIENKSQNMYELTLISYAFSIKHRIITFKLGLRDVILYLILICF
jgi:hypothetical protein